jgi:hypothetical protein
VSRKEFKKVLDVELGFKNVELFPPGRILHLHRKAAPPAVHSGGRSGRSSSFGSASQRDRQYEAVWSDASGFAEIDLSGSLLSDHNPNRIADEVQHLAETAFALQAPYYLPLGLQRPKAGVGLEPSVVNES